MTQTVTGLFDNASTAKNAVAELESIGVPHADISLVASDAHGEHAATKAGEDAGKGAGVGAAAFSQVTPPDRTDARGNSAVKQRHTVDDGGAKSGASSFTEGEARSHIIHSGYASVSTLSKGTDGAWRGTAM